MGKGGRLAGSGYAPWRVSTLETTHTDTGGGATQRPSAPRVILRSGRAPSRSFTFQARRRRTKFGPMATVITLKYTIQMRRPPDQGCPLLNIGIVMLHECSVASLLEGALATRPSLMLPL